MFRCYASTAGLRAQSRGGERSLGTGMAATYDNDLESVGILHCNIDL
jgi:hypothetical protein